MIARTFASFAVCMTLCFSAWGQEATPAPAASQPGGMMGGKAGMQEMMGKCMAKCQAQMQSGEQLMQTLEEAKESNDPAKMRAAIEQTQTALRQSKQTMSECAAMMQKMHGGMGMMGGQTTGSMGMMGQSGQSGAPQ